MRKKLFFIAGMFLVLAAIGWKYIVYPGFDIQKEVNYSLDFNHEEDNRFEIGGSWSGKLLSLGRLTMKTERVEGPVMYVDSKFEALTIDGATLFNLQRKLAVDRKTRLTLPASGFRSGSYFIFPPKVEKTGYIWIAPTIGESVNFRFVDEIKIQGLAVYHFRGLDDNLDDTGGFEFLPLVPETYKVSTRAVMDVYVEPRTGLIIQYEDHMTSSYLDDKGNRIWDMSARSNRTYSQVVSQRVSEARQRISTDNLFENGICLILLLVGSTLIVFKSRLRQP